MAEGHHAEALLSTDIVPSRTEQPKSDCIAVGTFASKTWASLHAESILGLPRRLRFSIAKPSQPTFSDHPRWTVGSPTSDGSTTLTRFNYRRIVRHQESGLRESFAFGALLAAPDALTKAALG